MTHKVPHFKFHIKSTSTKFYGRIELKGEVIYIIEDLGEFYKVCGYNLEMAKEAILPDQYIWNTFFRFNKIRNCSSCYQLHVIEFLLRHSDTFTKKFRNMCEDWIEIHAKARSACDVTTCADRKYAVTNKFV
jgi:hypothetical protein